MDTIEQSRIEIEESLTQRLATLAKDQGVTASDLANDVLRSFAQEIEDAMASTDTRIDEARWQEYLRTGETVSAEDFFATLDKLEARATAKIDGA